MLVTHLPPEEAPPEPQQGIPPPRPGDLLRAAGALGWPGVAAAGWALGPGEDSWRSGVQAMDDGARMAFWHEWGSSSHAVVEEIAEEASAAGDDPGARADGIRRAVRAAGLDAGLAEDLVQRDVTLDAARAEIVGQLASRQAVLPKRGPGRADDP